MSKVPVAISLEIVDPKLNEIVAAANERLKFAEMITDSKPPFKVITSILKKIYKRPKYGELGIIHKKYINKLRRIRYASESELRELSKEYLECGLALQQQKALLFSIMEKINENLKYHKTPDYIRSSIEDYTTDHIPNLFKRYISQISATYNYDEFKAKHIQDFYELKDSRQNFILEELNAPIYSFNAHMHNKDALDNLTTICFNLKLFSNQTKNTVCDASQPLVADSTERCALITRQNLWIGENLTEIEKNVKRFTDINTKRLAIVKKHNEDFKKVWDNPPLLVAKYYREKVASVTKDVADLHQLIKRVKTRGSIATDAGDDVKKMRADVTSRIVKTLQAFIVNYNNIVRNPLFDWFTFPQIVRSTTAEAFRPQSIAVVETTITANKFTITTGNGQFELPSHSCQVYTAYPAYYNNRQRYNELKIGPAYYDQATMRTQIIMPFAGYEISFKEPTLTSIAQVTEDTFADLLAIKPKTPVVAHCEIGMLGGNKVHVSLRIVKSPVIQI